MAASTERIALEQDESGGFYAVLYARNGKALWRTSESYTRKRAALRAVQCMRNAVVSLVTVQDRTQSRSPTTRG